MRALQLSIAGLFGVVVFVGTLSSILLSIMLTWAPNVERFMIITTWLVLVGLWAIQSLILLNNWKAKSYEVDTESIRLTKPVGLFKNTKIVYRYESIILVRMTQGFWGKKFGYGNVYFAIPKLEKEESLKGIENPAQQLDTIQKRLHHKGADTQVLIS